MENSKGGLETVSNLSVANMVSFESKVYIAKVVTKTLMYLGLFSIFTMYFMKDQFQAFVGGRTTMTIRTGKSGTFDFPLMTLCFHEGTKVTVRQKYNLSEPWSYQYNDQLNITMPEMLHKQSFILDRDFQLVLMRQKYYGPHFHQELLHEGKNFIKEDKNDNKTMILVTPTRTDYFGICYRIQLMKNVTFVPFRITLQILLNSTLDENKPKSLNLYLTSNNAYKNIANDFWPQYYPSKTKIMFDGRVHNIIISTKEHIFYHGKSSADEMGKCATSLIEKFCTNPCSVIDTITSPPCKTASEFLECTDKAFSENVKEYIDCFYTKYALTFNPQVNVHTDGKSKIDPNIAELSVAMRTMKKDTKEEIHLLTTPDLIGSIGGSLGMFFGFSIAPNLGILFEKLIFWICSKFQSRCD